MSGKVLVVLFCFLGAQLVVITPNVSGQEILPGIELECIEDNLIINPQLNKNENVHCVLTNNRPYDEDVSINYESEEFTFSGPNTVSISSGSEESFVVSVETSSDISSGFYEMNITAEVTTAVGIPVGFLTNTEEWNVEVELLEYTSCDVNYGVNSIEVNAGDIVTFSASYSCSSNLDQKMILDLHLVDENANSEGMWVSGFNILSSECSIQISSGSGVANCEFEMTTPSNLNEEYRGCLIILDERKLVAESCQKEESVLLVVAPEIKGVIENGLGSNFTILDDLGISEGEALIYGGGRISIIILIITFMAYRRMVV
jgi:hypothetical protein